MLLLNIINIIIPVAALLVGLAVGYFITATLLKKAVTKEENALLEEATFVCPSCGSLFERAPRAKTDLCPECQKKKDLSDQRAYRKRSYKSQKIAG